MRQRKVGLDIISTRKKHAIYYVVFWGRTHLSGQQGLQIFFIFFIFAYSISFLIKWKNKTKIKKKRKKENVLWKNQKASCRTSESKTTWIIGQRCHAWFILKFEVGFEFKLNHFLRFMFSECDAMQPFV